MTTQPNLFLRPDTLFGACQGLADDLGINALWLRVPLAASILYDPKIAFGTYAVLCLVVFATRKLWPAKTVAAPAADVVAEVRPATPTADNEQRELAHAA